MLNYVPAKMIKLISATKLVFLKNTYNHTCPYEKGANDFIHIDNIHKYYFVLLLYDQLQSPSHIRLNTYFTQDYFVITFKLKNGTFSWTNQWVSKNALHCF